MSALSTRPGRTFASLASLLLAACFGFGCGSSSDQGIFEAPPGAGGSSSGSGGTAPQGGVGGTVASGGADAGLGGQSTVSGGALGSSGGAVSSGGSAGKVSGGAAGASGAATGGATSAGASSGGASPSAGSANSGGASGSGGGACQAEGKEVCDGFDNDCNGSVDDAKACPAKCTGFVALGHRYMLCNTSTTQTKASTLCEEQGLRLAWLESADENEAVLAAVQALSGTKPAEAFIGATDNEVEGSWRWIGGAQFWQGESQGMAVNGAYANWSQGRPNDSGLSQDCAVMIIDMPADGQPGQWNDDECYAVQGVLCEKS